MTAAGHPAVFPAGEALPFITVDAEDGSMQVTDQAAKFLSGIQKPVVVVAVAGKYRSGKSTLLCRLIGRPGSVRIGHTIRACTKGLLLYGAALDLGDRVVLMVDSEGLLALDTDATHDARVFALSVLLSSNFVYNVSGAIDETTLSTLRVVVEFAAKMNEANSADRTAPGGPCLADVMPGLTIVVRDFALQLERADGHPMTPTEWFEDALCTRESTASSGRLAGAGDKVAIREAIKEVFPVRRCHTMPRPSYDDAVLGRMETTADSELTPAFVKACSELRCELLMQSPIKRVMGEPVTGAGLLAMANGIVAAINAGHAPVIRDSWALLSEMRARDAADAATGHFETVTRTWHRTKVMPAVMRLGLMRVREEALRIYDKAAPPKGCESSRLRLVEGINEKSERLCDAHSSWHVDCVERHATTAREALDEYAAAPAASGGDDRVARVLQLMESTERRIAEELGASGAGGKRTPAERKHAGLDSGWRNGLRSSLLEACVTTVAAGMSSDASGIARISELEADLIARDQAIQEHRRIQRDAVSKLEEVQRTHAADLKLAVRTAEADCHKRAADLETAARRAGTANAAVTKRLEHVSGENAQLQQDIVRLSGELRAANVALEDARAEIRGNATTQDRSAASIAEAEELRAQLDTAVASAELAREQLQTVRDERASQEASWAQAADEVRKHADMVIADRTEDATKRCMLAEKAAAGSEAARKELQVRMSEMSAQTKVTTAKLEAAVREHTKQAEVAERLAAEAKELQQSLRAANEQHAIALSGARSELVCAVSSHAEDVERRASAWADERLRLESACARLQGQAESSKRELQRGDDACTEAKRLRICLQDAKVDVIRGDSAKAALQTQLQSEREALRLERQRALESEQRAGAVARDLAVAEFKVSLTKASSQEGQPG